MRDLRGESGAPLRVGARPSGTETVDGSRGKRPQNNAKRRGAFAVQPGRRTVRTQCRGPRKHVNAMTRREHHNTDEGKRAQTRGWRLR